MIVSLRELALSDVPLVSQYVSDLDVAQFIGDDIPNPYTIKNAQAFIAETIDSFPLYCAIEVDGAFAGAIGLREKGGVYCANLELGYWLAKPFWSKGIMTEAIRQMTNVAFRQTGIVRVFANVFQPNIGSQIVLERNGYQKEGYHRNALLKNGQIYDCIVYAMCKEQWYEPKKAL